MSEMSEQVVEFVKAGFSGIWVHTNEQEDAMSDLIASANANEWSLGFWDIGEGLRGTERIAAQKPQEEDRWHDRNVSQMLRELPTIAATTGHKKTLLVLKNFHRRELIDNTSHIQLLQSSLQAGKAEEHGWCIVVLAPKINVPMELDPDFVVVTHELPDKDQLWAVAESVAEEGELPEGEGEMSRARSSPFPPNVSNQTKFPSESNLAAKASSSFTPEGASFSVLSGLIP